MNRYSVITTVAIALIIIPFVYSGLNIFVAQQMEYRWNNPEEFSFFTMSNHGEMEFCNTMPFWVSIQRFEINTYYDAKYTGSFVVKPPTISPYSSTVEKGVFSSEELVESQHKFITLDFEFDGGDIRLDPNKFIVTVQRHTPIIGIIPYSSATQISGFEFDNIMNSEDLVCD